MAPGRARKKPALHEGTRASVSVEREGETPQQLAVGRRHGHQPADREEDIGASPCAPDAMDHDDIYGDDGSIRQDYLTAIGQIRPTLTAGMLAEFDRGKDDFARL